MLKRISLLFAAIALLTACGDSSSSEVTCNQDCTQIPNPVCDGSAQVSALGAGQCVEGICQWVPVRTECPFGCADGACNAPPVDPCEGITCDAPPAPSCNATVAVVSEAAGTCAEGRCTYATTETDCATSGEVCDAGACRAPLPCDGVTCNAPPAAFCDGRTAVAYPEAGICDGGNCNYQEVRTDCVGANDCIAGACVPVDRCSGVSCDAPPAPFCRGAVATSYDASGACEAATGNCTYNTNSTDCAASGLRCVAGECQLPAGDPCAGVVCNAPIGATCDGSTANTFVGTCNPRTRACEYSDPIAIDCAATGLECVAGRCLPPDLCAGVSCEAPPAATCEGTVSVVSTLPGLCTDGNCGYSVVRTNCAARGFVCQDGFCTDPAACIGVACDAPPAPVCVGQRAVAFGSAGSCRDGECFYPETSEDCAAFGGTCVAGTCDYAGSCNVSECITPPFSFCDGETAVRYPANGSCVRGACGYAETRVDCAALGSSCIDAACINIDLCEGVTCTNPPADRCVGNSLRSFGEGVCNPGTGVCEYAPLNTDCAANSATCVGTACIPNDLCAGIVCNTPPSPVCAGGSAVSYSLPGTCVAGDCFYAEATEDCSLDSGICVGGACQTLNPCLGVSCATPPDSTCVGDTAVVYGTTGLCLAGDCNYQRTETDCAASGGICADAACQTVDRCAGVSCDAPPAGVCESGSVVRLYNGVGTCDAATGACDYASGTLDCSENGEACADGACVPVDPCVDVTCAAFDAPFCTGDLATTVGEGYCVDGGCEYGDAISYEDCTLAGKVCVAGTCQLPAATVAAGDLIITEASFASSSAGSWFEVRNISGRELDLRGLTIRSGAQTLFIGAAQPIAAGDYGVLASSSALFGDVVPTMTSDTFPALSSSTAIALLAGSTAVAEMNFASGVATGAGASSQLEPRSYATAATAAASWCLSTESYGTGLLGTPGFTNSPCAANVAAFAEITEVMLLPAEEPDFAYQWFEIRNRTASAVDLTGLQIVIGGVVAAQLGEGNVLPASELLVFGTTPGAAGGASDILYGTSATAVTPGSIALRMAGVTIDQVSWDGTWPVSAAASMQVSNSAASNDSRANWCLSTNRYDGTLNLGSPGSLNATCTPP